MKGPSTALALGADISRRPESANNTWRGVCFPMRPIWRESSPVAQDDAARDKAHLDGPARLRSKPGECVAQCPSRASAEAPASSESRGRGCLGPGRLV